MACWAYLIYNHNMTRVTKNVFIAVSGGVDSATTAAMLCQEGYNCSGIFMINHDHYESAQQDAQTACDKLGIELHVLDLRQQFKSILDYFFDEYRHARTPNPCVVCNRQIKFGLLWQYARDRGADYLATGHYARVIRSQSDVGLYAAINSPKDQSYALAMIDRHVLPHIILKLGEQDKDQTRKLAEQFKLGVQHKQDSQDICFIPDDDYIALIEKNHPELARRGPIVDTNGKILGEHNGIHRYTIGQRRGLKVAMGIPYYVVRLDADTNTVVLGKKEDVMSDALLARNVNWLIEKPETVLNATIKIRYNDRGHRGRVVVNGDRVRVEFDQPVSAVTPGQLAVFYMDDENGRRVAGGGWIDTVKMKSNG